METRTHEAVMMLARAKRAMDHAECRQANARTALQVATDEFKAKAENLTYCYQKMYELVADIAGEPEGAA
jgi:hypothetical protein